MARDIASFMLAVQWCQHPRQWHKHRQMPLPMLLSLSGQVFSLCRAPVYGHDRSIQIVTWTYVNMLSTFVFTVYWAVQCLSLLLLSSNAFADCWIFKVFLCQSALIFVFFNKLASGYIWMNVKDCWLCDIVWFDSLVCMCLCACVYTCVYACVRQVLHWLASMTVGDIALRLMPMLVQSAICLLMQHGLLVSHGCCSFHFCQTFLLMCLMTITSFSALTLSVGSFDP